MADSALARMLAPVTNTLSKSIVIIGTSCVIISSYRFLEKSVKKTKQHINKANTSGGVEPPAVAKNLLSVFRMLFGGKSFTLVSNLSSAALIKSVGNKIIIQGQ